jgi:hypothetical protein
VKPIVRRPPYFSMPIFPPVLLNKPLIKHLLSPTLRLFGLEMPIVILCLVRHNHVSFSHFPP